MSYLNYNVKQRLADQFQKWLAQSSFTFFDLKVYLINKSIILVVNQHIDSELNNLTTYTKKKVQAGLEKAAIEQQISEDKREAYKEEQQHIKEKKEQAELNAALRACLAKETKLHDRLALLHHPLYPRHTISYQYPNQLMPFNHVD